MLDEVHVQRAVVDKGVNVYRRKAFFVEFVEVRSRAEIVGVEILVASLVEHKRRVNAADDLAVEIFCRLVAVDVLAGNKPERSYRRVGNGDAEIKSFPRSHTHVGIGILRSQSPEFGVVLFRTRREVQKVLARNLVVNALGRPQVIAHPFGFVDSQRHAVVHCAARLPIVEVAASRQLDVRSVRRRSVVIVLERRSFSVLGGRNDIRHTGALGHVLVEIAAVFGRLLGAHPNNAAVAAPEHRIVLVQQIRVVGFVGVRAVKVAQLEARSASRACYNRRYSQRGYRKAHEFFE